MSRLLILVRWMGLDGGVMVDFRHQQPIINPEKPGTIIVSAALEVFIEWIILFKVFIRKWNFSQFGVQKVNLKFISRNKLVSCAVNMNNQRHIQVHRVDILPFMFTNKTLLRSVIIFEKYDIFFHRSWTCASRRKSVSLCPVWDETESKMRDEMKPIARAG